VRYLDKADNLIKKPYSLSTAIGGCRGIVVKDKLYVFGGVVNGNSSQSKAQTVDLKTGARALLRDTPSAMYDMALATDGNRYIYIVPGWEPLFYRYDIVNNSYTTLASMPWSTSARISGGILVLHDGALYYLCGWVSASPTGYNNAKVWKYTFATNKWTVYDTIDAIKHGSVHLGYHYHEGIVNYLSWAKVDSSGVTKMYAQRYDIDKKTFAQPFLLPFGYRNMTGVTGNGNTLYFGGGTYIAAGRSDTAAIGTNYRDLWQLEF